MAGWRSWGALFVGLALAWGCGGSEEEVGFKPAGGTGGSRQDAGPSDGGIPWPDADPGSDAPPGPSPGFDAGSGADAQPFGCSAKTGEKGRRTIQVLSGIQRSAILYVPESYDPTRGTMLVLNFHGFSSADWQEELLSRMNPVADRKGFIIAYPSGIATSWNAGDCCGTAWTDSVDDVQFVSDLIDQLSAEYCIDPARIYATGMSNGGFMSHRLGCDMSDRIAAIAPVAGVLGMPPDDCHPTRPVPVLHFHGTADGLVPYEGGAPVIPDLGSWFRSVADTMTFWRTNNACSANEEIFFQNGDTTCVRWPDCAGFIQTALCTVDGGGHTWPGGMPVPFLGKTSTDISATETMIEFFEAHPMR